MSAAPVSDIVSRQSDESRHYSTDSRFFASKLNLGDWQTPLIGTKDEFVDDLLNFPPQARDSLSFIFRPISGYRGQLVSWLRVSDWYVEGFLVGADGLDVQIEQLPFPWETEKDPKISRTVRDAWKYEGFKKGFDLFDEDIAEANFGRIADRLTNSFEDVVLIIPDSEMIPRLPFINESEADRVFEVIRFDEDGQSLIGRPINFDRDIQSRRDRNLIRDLIKECKRDGFVAYPSIMRYAKKQTTGRSSDLLTLAMIRESGEAEELFEFTTSDLSSFSFLIFDALGEQGRKIAFEGGVVPVKSIPAADREELYRAIRYPFSRSVWNPTGKQMVPMSIPFPFTSSFLSEATVRFKDVKTELCVLQRVERLKKSRCNEASTLGYLKFMQEQGKLGESEGELPVNEGTFRSILRQDFQIEVNQNGSSASFKIRFYKSPGKTVNSLKELPSNFLNEIEKTYGHYVKIGN